MSLVKRNAAQTKNAVIALERISPALKVPHMGQNILIFTVNIKTLDNLNEIKAAHTDFLMKHLLIDLYKTKTLYSGLGQFSLNFAQELMRQLPSNISIDFLAPSQLPPLALDERSHFVKSNLQIKLLPQLNKTYSIWHSLYQSPSRVPNKNTPQIMTVHDLNFLVEKEPKKQGKYLKKLQKSVNRATHIVAISNYAKESLEKNIDLKGKKVKVIHNGVIATKGSIGKPMGIKDKPFFFSIGIFHKKKHFESLIPLVKALGTDKQLVIAGDCNTAYGQEVKGLIDKHGMSDQVILTGMVTDAERHWLYANCEALLFPSKAEGFGMPPIEAMQFGKPVFLSKLCSLPEVGGEVAYYFDDINNYEDMASVVKQGMNDFYKKPEYFMERSKAHAAHFSWQKAMEEYIKLYIEVLS